MSAPFVQAHGARIPLIGLGTWELRGRTCARMVEQALRLGYRHIDTAELYDNEGVALAFCPARPRAIRAAEPDAIATAARRPAPAALAQPADPAARYARRAVQSQARGARSPHRSIELHGRTRRGGGEACGRAAGLQSDRGASFHRSVEGDRGLPPARHGDRRLQSRRPRWR